MRSTLVRCGLIVVSLCCLLPMPGIAQTDEKQDDLAKKARAEKLLKWTRDFSDKTRMAVMVDGKEQLGELKVEPVMRYSDEPRFITDATLWVWSLNSRPVAIQKVEVNDLNEVPLWTICFGSFAESNVDVRWPSGQTFKSTEAGWAFAPIPNAEAPAEGAAVRTLQMRALSRRFSGSVYSTVQKSSIEMRLLPKPLLEYSDPETKQPLGAVFSFASNGTNPTIFVVIEARKNKEGQLGWYHARTRMTGDSGLLRLDDQTIWEFNEPKRENWTYFFIRRNLDFKD